ncbi:MAG: aminotransferase class V-fold PLP-dependent enzyme [Caldilineaceae bacterium]
MAPVLNRFLKSTQRWQAEFEEHPGGFLHRWTDLMLEGVRARLSTCTPTKAAWRSSPTPRWGQRGDAFAAQLAQTGRRSAHHQPRVRRLQPRLAVQLRQGWRRVHQPSHRSAHPPDEQFIEQFWAGVTPRTRVIHLSHTTSPTALTFPLEELCRRAREAGILSARDRRRDVPGQRDLFLDDLGADFYTGNGHKWMCSPMIAFLYVRPEVQHLIEPIIVGHGWFPDKVSEKPLVDYVESYGTCDLSGFLAVPAAIDYMEAHDWPAVFRCHAMGMATKHELERHFGTESILPRDFRVVQSAYPHSPARQHRHGQVGPDHARGIQHRDAHDQLERRQDRPPLGAELHYTRELDLLVETITTHQPACLE